MNKLKKYIKWELIFAVILVFISIILYIVHYSIFKDKHHIFIYFVSDVAFLPIEVLIVSMILHQLLSYREKKSKINKLNMVIGAFFSEVGTKLLTYYVKYDKHFENVQKSLLINLNWKDTDFKRVYHFIDNLVINLSANNKDFNNLKKYLIEKRSFLLGLLENPNLLEHERFTNLLWAVFHLTEELNLRKSFNNSQKDISHLLGDIKRSYKLLIKEWIFYMQHLKNDYPYLFSLALRTNPFDVNANPIIY